MSVNNFLKAVFESCYVVFVALRVVKSVYILSSQNVTVKLTNVYTGEMHLSGWFTDSAEVEKKDNITVYDLVSWVHRSIANLFVL